MPLTGWHQSADIKPWGQDVAVRTPRGGTIYKHPKQDKVYQTAREALYFGRLGFRHDMPTYEQQLDLLRDVMAMVNTKHPPGAIAAKLFGHSNVLLDQYLALLNREFLARFSESEQRWRLSAEGKAVLLMLNQTSASIPPEYQVYVPNTEEAKPPRRRRIMMEIIESRSACAA